MFLYPLEYEPPGIDITPEFHVAVGISCFFIALFVVAIVLRVLISIFAAKQLQKSASRKGLDSVYGWTILIGILAGLPGIAVIALIVLASPDHSNTVNAEYTERKDGDDSVQS